MQFNNFLITNSVLIQWNYIKLNKICVPLVSKKTSQLRKGAKQFSPLHWETLHKSKINVTSVKLSRPINMQILPGWVLCISLSLICSGFFFSKTGEMQIMEDRWKDEKNFYISRPLFRKKGLWRCTRGFYPSKILNKTKAECIWKLFY